MHKLLWIIGSCLVCVTSVKAGNLGMTAVGACFLLGTMYTLTGDEG